LDDKEEKKYLEILCCNECPYYLTDNYGRKYCFQTGTQFKDVKPFMPVKFRRNCPLSNVKGGE